MTTRLESAELILHGQTTLNADNATQARLEFSHFNIDSLLKRPTSPASTANPPLPEPSPSRAPSHSLTASRRGPAGRARSHRRRRPSQSQGGVHATLANARVRLDPFHITGEETDLHAQGNLALTGTRQLDFAASGSINLKVAQTLDPDLTAGGNTTFQVRPTAPSKTRPPGSHRFSERALSLEDVPNGLSQFHGSLEFNQNRLEVRSLTAMSGGGLLSVAGILAYQHGLYADLSVTGNRHPHPLSPGRQLPGRRHAPPPGPAEQPPAPGNVLITRFTISPDLDIVALAAQANSASAITPPDAPSNHIRLDVRIASSPQLNFQNAFAKLAGDVDLRLRGTLASPSLLGRVSITEGSAIIAGTRYDLQRGEISFTNPVRIQPTIDLNATARVEDYDITLGLHGTPSKPAVTYRSDPPLPESESSPSSPSDALKISSASIPSSRNRPAPIPPPMPCSAEPSTPP